MKAPAHLLVKHQHKVANEEERKLAMDFLFRPVIEQIESDDSIITASPEELLKQYDSIDMPLITGCTDSEGILPMFLMRRKSQTEAFRREPERWVPCFLRNDPAVDLDVVGKIIEQFYFGSKVKHSQQKICDLMSDNSFITTTMINAELLAKYQPRVQHFHYRFTYHGRLSLFKGIFRMDDIEGACHGDDQYYIFNSPMLPCLASDSDENKVRNNIVKLWTSFAKYGNPTPLKQNSMHLTWPTVQCQVNDATTFHLNYLDINVELNVRQSPNKARVDFWRHMIYQYRKALLH